MDPLTGVRISSGLPLKLDAIHKKETKTPSFYHLAESNPVLVPSIYVVIPKFYDYCSIDERLQPRVSKDYRNIIRRFLKHSENVVSEENIRSYLSAHLDKAPKTYNNQLDGLRAFIVRYLKRPDLMDDFKKAHIPLFERELHTNEQIRRGFYGLTDVRERAIYLFYASTGLRSSEVLELEDSDVDLGLRLVRSRHDTRTKKAGITFYNGECEKFLEKYLPGRSRGRTERLFIIGWRQFLEVWEKASKEAGFRITPQVLRVWFASEMGELGVPDRYVDIFQGRAPKTVLAKHYTGKGFEILKRIYDKADLKILS